MNMSYSFWENDSFIKEYDLVVVGAGITGCSAVLSVLEKYPDWKVLLLERGFYPSGASSRNAGFSCFGSVSELLDDLKHTPAEKVKELVSRRYRGLQLLRNTVPEQEIDYEFCGGFELFRDASEYEKCTDALEMFNEWLFDISGEKQVYKAVEKNGYKVIHNRLEGYLHSGKLVRWLHKKVADAGAELRWNCEVGAVSSGKVVLKSGAEIAAGRILLATNGFSREITEQSGVRPARGLVMVTNELETMPWLGAWHYDKGFVYFRNLGKRLLIGGGRNQDISGEETTEDAVNPVIKAYLIDFMRETLRLDGNWTIDFEWTGIMGFGEGKGPSCREIEVGVWIAAGLGGMGVALGMQFGKDVAKEIVGE